MQLGNGSGTGGGNGDSSTPFGNGNGGASSGGVAGVSSGGFPSSPGGAGGASGFASSGGISGSGGAGGTPGASGSGGFGGVSNNGGFGGTGGVPSSNSGGSGGTLIGNGGTSAASGGAGGMSNGDGETGRLVGMTAAHNAVRAMVMTTPPLAPLTWSTTIAAYAQQWADSLAATSCASPHHRTEQELQQVGYGENLAAFSMGGSFSSPSTAQDAVNGWAAEVSCWTYGAIATTEKCDPTCYQNLNSDGCGHYTQIVWRSSMQLGCGVASCNQGNFTTDIWICNYAPAGNFEGQTPY